jgi:hypothetical protein
MDDEAVGDGMVWITVQANWFANTGRFCLAIGSGTSAQCA